MKQFLKGFLGIILCYTSLSASSGTTYYLIAHGSQDPYWNTLFQGAKAAANDLHVELQILAPSGAHDIAKQVQYLESAIATQPLGIATTIPSDSAFSKSLQHAKQISIPVIAFDTKPKDREKNPYLAFIGSDNQFLGQSLATRAYDSHLVEKRAVILNPQPGHVGLAARAKGIKTVLKAKNIIVDELDVGIDASQVQTRVRSYLQRYPNLSAIFCLTSQALDPLGQLLAHRDAHGSGSNLSVLSFDKTPNTVHFIDKGFVAFAIDQQPFLMGYLSIAELVLHNKNHLNPVNVNTAN
jgi:simple sugar transport system substrate-binding protein